MSQKKKTVETEEKNSKEEKEKVTSEPVKESKPPKEKKHREKVPGDPEALRTQIVIAVFGIIALLSAVFFIANIWDDAGPLIEGFATVAYGLFGWGGLLIVPFFMLLAVEWKKIVVERSAAFKIITSLVGLVIASALFHVIIIMNGGIAQPKGISVLNSTVFWYKGHPLGGGVIGGFFGGIFYALMHGWVSVIACLILLVADVMIYLRLTPTKAAQGISAWWQKTKQNLQEKNRLAAEKREKEEAEKKAEKEAKAEEQRLLEEEKKKLEEEEARRRAEEEAEKRHRDPGIEFDFLKEKESESKYETTEKEASASEEEVVPLPISVYTAPAKKERKAKDGESYDFDNIPAKKDKGLDEIESTDFGTGIEDNDFDLSALLAKKSDDEVFVDEEDEEEDELPDEVDPVIPVSEPSDKPKYIYPPTSLLSPNANPKTEDDKEELMRNARKLVEVLKSFRVETEIVNISRGPTITRYELAPKIGVRVRAIANLVDDIALNLETSGVRIEAPIPGKAAVGVEVPNKTAEIVYLRDIIESDVFQNAKSKLTACVGMDVSGTPIVMDITKLPHMLIAGATGMGKSIAVNCIIMSLLYKTTPDELKLILVDPKKVEFRPYDKLPHLLIPVVTNPKKAAGALATAVNEMERRFELIELAGVRDIKGYNKLAENDPTKEKLPSIVIIIDELADLMMTAKDDVEDSICRIAQKARAAGIHLIICTQRPSVDVITGLIKANVPSRMALTVASNIDSRTIIDIAGAEKLIGRGDMLYAPVGAMKPMRVQGAYVSDAEVEAVTSFIRNQFQDVHYDDTFINQLEIEAERCGQQKKKVASDEIDADDDLDPKFYEAVEIAVEMGKISTSLLQRRLSLGYGRAAKIIDKMEQMGVVGPQEGQKPRNILISRQDYQEMMMRRDDPQG